MMFLSECSPCLFDTRVLACLTPGCGYVQDPGVKHTETRVSNKVRLKGKSRLLQPIFFRCAKIRRKLIVNSLVVVV